MKYKIPIQEEIRVWQNVDVYIETDDTPEDVYRHMEKGDFLSHYSIDDYSNADIMFETEENIGYDYDNTTLSEIKEI